MNRSILRLWRAAAPALAAVAWLLTACGGGSGGGGSGSGSANLVIDGTWVDEAQPTARGRFTMTGNTDVKNFSGTLSGNLQFYSADGSLLTSEPVTGTVSKDIGATRSPWSIDFATGDGKLTFFTASYDGYASSSKLGVGEFTNTKSTSRIQGRWRNNPAGGPSDCVIDKAFTQTGYTIQDLAWSGSKLVAIATPTAGSAGVYEIDVSGLSPGFTLQTLAPAPANPKGIAWDGANYWVASPSTTSFPATFTLDAYTSTWLQSSSRAGTGITGNMPSWIAFWSGNLWYAPLLDIVSYRIDPATGTVTAVPSLQLNRPNGADSDGTSIWVASDPPGGVWGPLLKYDTTGSLLATVYAPEAGGADAVACESAGFIWVATGQDLYRLAVR